MKRLLMLAAVLAALLPTAGLAQFGNATRLRGLNICANTPADTNVLGWSAANNCWQPGAGGGSSNVVVTTGTVPPTQGSGCSAPSTTNLAIYVDTVTNGGTLWQSTAASGNCWQKIFSSTSIGPYYISGVAAPYSTGVHASIGTCTTARYYLDSDAPHGLYVCDGVSGSFSAAINTSGTQACIMDSTTPALRCFDASGVPTIAPSGWTDDGTTITAAAGRNVSVGNTVLLNPSGDTTGAADTVAIQALIEAHKSVHLAPGAFYTGAANTGIVLDQMVSLQADSPEETILWNAGTTNYAVTINYLGLPGDVPASGGATVRGFSIKQKTGVTPTAGGAILVQSTSPYYLTGLHLENIHIDRMWGGIYTGAQVYLNWFKDIWVNDSVSGGNGCFYYNTATPAGDNHVENLECRGPNTGVTVAQADTTIFSGLKLNFSGFVFTGAGSTTHVRIIDPSIESAPTCSMDFGTGSTPSQIQIIGGAMGLAPTAHAFCNKSNTSLLSYAFDDYSLSDTITGPIISGFEPDGNFFVGERALAFTGIAAQAGATGLEVYGSTAANATVSYAPGGGAYAILGALDATASFAHTEFSYLVPGSGAGATPTTCHFWKIDAVTVMKYCGDGTFQVYGAGANVKIIPTASTITGTSGTADCSMSLQGTLKTATCYLAAYANTSTAQTYAYPTGFSSMSLLVGTATGGTSCGTYNPTTTTSTLTLPANASMTAETCSITVIGQ